MRSLILKEDLPTVQVYYNSVHFVLHIVETCARMSDFYILNTVDYKIYDLRSNDEHD